MEAFNSELLLPVQLLHSVDYSHPTKPEMQTIYLNKSEVEYAEV